MDLAENGRYTAFEGVQCIASGEMARVALKSKEVIDRGTKEPVLIFDDATGESVEVDFRGTPEEVLKRVPGTTVEGVPEPVRGPGRPRLGVVAREVTLLPRHWDWLNGQPGGASVAIRRLVEDARRANEGTDRVRKAQEAAYRFMATMAGNLPGFEEVTRAFFAGDPDRFHERVEAWPADIRDHARKLAAVALQGTAGG